MGAGLDVPGMRGPRGALGRDACLIYVMGFLTSSVSQMMNVIFVLYATDEFGMSDISAGVLYGWWGILASLWSAPLAVAVDICGVKPMAIGSSLLMGVTRTSIALTRSAYTLQVVVLGFSPIAEGLPGAIQAVAIKRVTSEEQRGMAFSLVYALHAAGGGVADMFIELLRQWHGTYPRSFAFAFGGSFTPVRVCMLSTVFVLLASACLACALPRQLGPRWRQVYTDIRDGEDSPGKPLPDSRARPARSACLGVLRDILLLLTDRSLWFVALTASCLVFAKMQWHHMNATMPKYLIRELGEGVPWATVNSIHYWVCTALPPFMALGLSSWSEYSTVVIGSTIMAVAPIFMVLDVSTLAACAWLAVMSLGEVIWSPRFNALCANLSPPGREGAFLVLAYTPQFFASLPTGWLSGVLLETYCPDCPGCRDGRTGSFCSVDCSTAGAPLDACSPGLQCAAPSLFSRGQGSCVGLERGAGGCPWSCASCPSWRQRADGRRLWLWVLGISLLAPALLLLLRLAMTPPEPRDMARVCPRGGEPSEVGLELEDAEARSKKLEPVVVGLSNLEPNMYPLGGPC